MENRKFIKFLFPILVLGFFIFGNTAYAYNVPTHEFLTKSIAEFYNKNFPKKEIPKEIINYLIDGSGQEDNVPRYFNHFYDPINDRGLQDKIYRGMASKSWAQNEEAQLALIYRILPHTEASILTAAEIQKIQPEFSQSDFTWQKAIDLYAKGEKEQAFFALGHILHLIEDASVPDHTRNDSHPPYDDGGSPYENWTAKFTSENPDKELATRLKNKKPILVDNVDSYFDAIANYSNNNFYSKDSIKNYEFPVKDYSKQIGEAQFDFKKDQEFGDYRLAKEEAPDLVSGKSKIIISEDLIMKDYWSHLSTKDVQYGAGIINLFFKEGEAAREKYLTEKAQRPYLATLIDGVSSIFGGGETHDIADTVNEFKLVAEVPIAEKKQETSNKKKEENTGTIPTEIVSLQLQSQEIATAPAEPRNDNPLCPFSTSQSPSHSGVVVNEVAWMGSAKSSSDEWIELKNISGREVDLDEWQVVDLGEKIKIQLSGKLPAGGFYLLERTDDSSVPGVSADQIYTGALANVGEGLHLFDKNCVLVDEAMAAPDWPAGDNNFKYTMERAADFSWRNYNGAGQNGINGTPKAENSPGAAPINYQSGSSNTKTTAQTPAQSEPQPQPDTQTQPSPELEATTTPAAAVSTPKVLISEILFDASGSDNNKEFIELYNPSDTAVDLSAWSIQHQSASGSLTKKNFEAGNSIAAKSFFLIWLGDDARADLKWASGSLNNTNATIYLVNNTNLVSTTSPTSVDSVSYDLNNLPGFVAGQSLERKAFRDGLCAIPWDSGEYLGNGCDTDGAGDWELRPMPNPQNRQSLPEPRGAPAAVTNFQISYASTSLSTSSSSTAELVFSWDAVAGADKYHLLEINPTLVFNATTTANQATMSVGATGLEYKFEIYSVDKDGLYSSSTLGSIFVPEPEPEPEPAPEPEPPPQPAPSGISNVIFSHDAGGNYISFTLNDTLHVVDFSTIHYILVWLNSDPKEMTVANRNSGIASNWAGVCPSSGIVAGNGGTEAAGGTGFDNYVMPDFQTANNNIIKPPVYDSNQPSYNYKVYFTAICPNTGFIGGRDLKGELTADDFVTVGLWLYHQNVAIINEVQSINYQTRYHFQP